MLSTSTRTRIVTAGSGTVAVPTGALAMRVAVIGGGGGQGSDGSRNNGGGGGGCAASKIVPAAAITYTIGSGGSADGQDSIASWDGYAMTGGGGKSGATRAGGTATGGDYNFSGGNGGFSPGPSYTSGGTGGGAAGPAGNGGSGVSVGLSSSSTGGSGAMSLTNGWGWGGGRGGSYANDGNDGHTNSGAGSGAASGQASSSYVSGTGVYKTGTTEAQSTPLFGKGAEGAWKINSSSRSTGAPGEMGGGGCSVEPSGGRSGAVGGIVIEWFYEE